MDIGNNTEQKKCIVDQMIMVDAYFLMDTVVVNVINGIQLELITVLIVGLRWIWKGDSDNG